MRSVQTGCSFRYRRAPLTGKYILQCRPAGGEYYQPVYQTVSVLAVDTEEQARKALDALRSHHR